MAGKDSKPPPMALHSTPAGFQPNVVFRFARSAYHRMPGSGLVGPALKAVFYQTLGLLAPRSKLVQRYQAWQTLQARKSFFREPLPGTKDLDDRIEKPAIGPSARGLLDIIFFPVIDWDFRFQRPQQMAVEFARCGHRVFYLEPEVDPRGKPGDLPKIKEEREGIYRVLLPHSPAVKVYETVCSDDSARALRQSLERMLDQMNSRSTASVLNHPGWFPVAHHLPSNLLVYDCMDYHAGFGGMSAGMRQLEEQCIRHADLLVVTAQRLKERFQAIQEPVLIPNATDFDYFSRRPEQIHPYGDGKVLGYYGAIAEWFDTELAMEIARTFPQHRLVLIGDTFGSDIDTLRRMANVEMPGEIPYGELTRHLYAFDVCLLPFKVNELTLATNPVKIFEYLSAGKPVVSIALPEVEPLSDYLYLADSPASFLRAIEQALVEDPSRQAARRAFAEGQRWSNRTEAIRKAIDEKATPRVSVVILVYNNLELTQACLRSVLQDSDYPNLEVIVADNGSDKETVAFLTELEKKETRVRCVFHGRNLGFAAGNNKAVAQAAQGAFLVFLNNDTQITPGWIRNMLRHFKDREKLGLLGPVTNNIGNEARIEITYQDRCEMLKKAQAYCRAHAGQSFDLRAPAFFCAMVPTSLWKQTGGLDERFGLGFFEDDDFAMKIREAGYETRCAEDVFIHHHLSASFDKRSERENAVLFERNRKLFEEKWGPWKPHEERG